MSSVRRFDDAIARPLRVVWVADGEIRADRTLRPWTGVGVHRADRVLEAHPETDTETLYQEVATNA